MVKVNNLRFADDSVSINRWIRKCLEWGNWGKFINTDKTVFMVVTKNKEEVSTKVLKLKECCLKKVEGFVIASHGKDVGVKSRIMKANTVFNKIKTVLINNNILIKQKVRIIKCYVWSVLCESWNLNNKLKTNMEAAKMWFYRRILKKNLQIK